MSPVVSSLLLGLVLCWSDTQATVPEDVDLVNVCPPYVPSTCPFDKPRHNECKTDSQCLGGKKCCCSNCGLKCVHPKQVKPGRCPDIVVRCKTPLPEPTCQSDLNCPGKQKCCEMCGISCRDPVEEPRGVCPASEVEAGRRLTCASFQCSRDSDCWAHEKCCVFGDGKRCVKPSPDVELINVCPRFDPSICLLAKPGPEGCKTDSQCLGGKKCCCSDCGLKCVSPQQVKPGRCLPIVVRCKTPLPEPTCQSDLNCPGKQKCCEMCGISCSDPAEEPHGVCPASEVKAGRSLTCASFQCSRDADCQADEKCCVSGDGKKCVKLSPDVELISVCPAFDPSICPLAKPGPEGCKTDSQCLGGKKCCCSNCGLKCVSPQQVKPGRCPPIVVRCKTPLPDPTCQSDLNCPGKQKCCEMCGISCSDPEEEPRGVCPANEVKEGRSLTCASFQCSRDSDCWADEKCCVFGDGKKCVKLSPDVELINVCPPFDPSICPLAKPGPEGCKTDSQCLGGKKCCCSNCGLKCVSPQQVKPGRCPPLLAKCMPIPEPKCQSDLDCPGKQKCCEICGKSCWDPAEEPRGVCPAIEAGRSLTCASFQCSRDRDCWADEKCCVFGDGKKCLKLSPDFPGSSISDGEKKYH